MLGKLKSLFVELDETPKTTKSVVAEPVPVAKPVVTTLAPSSGQVDQEIAQILEKAIADSNLAGFDYLEFREVLAGMAGVPLTEEQKFQTAFSAAKPMGVNKATLTNAIDHYLGVLEAQKVEFQNYVAGVVASDITSKEKVIESTAQEIQREAAEIERLTKSIQDRRKQQDDASIEIAQAKVAIQNKILAFEATLAAIVGSLNADKTKIETFLK